VIRVFALLARRPDLSRKDFQDHYESHHVPLARRLIPEFCHYVRNHVREVLGAGEASFETLSEFGYPDLETFQLIGERMSSQAGAALREDELTFMDKRSNLFFRAHHYASGGSPTGTSATETTRFALLCSRPAEWEGRDYAGAVARDLTPICDEALAWEHWAAEPQATTLGRSRDNPWDTLTLLDCPKHAIESEKLCDYPSDTSERVWLRVEPRVTKRG